MYDPVPPVTSTKATPVQIPVQVASTESVTITISGTGLMVTTPVSKQPFASVTSTL